VIALVGPVRQEWFLVTPALAREWLGRLAFAAPFSRTTQLLASVTAQRYGTVAFDRDGALLFGAACLRSIVRGGGQQVLLVFFEKGEPEAKG
jgi:hypothetical protein